MKRPKVLLADDHAMVAEGLANILKSDFDLVGTVSNGRELVATATDIAPDVIVVDISMPSLNGLEAVRQLKKAENRAKIVFLTMHADADMATEAFRSGASGYVLKHSAGGELIEAIRAALDGRVYLSPSIQGEVLEAFIRGGGEPEKGVLELTSRQREILQLVAEGRTMKEIATQLGISTRTVESHKYDMMEKLGLKSTAELIQFAIKRGIVRP
jgi:DNA-binding NarL/FixJ family response regulator